MKAWQIFAFAGLPLVLLFAGVICGAMRTNGASRSQQFASAQASPTAGASPAAAATAAPQGANAVSITIVGKNVAFDQTSLTAPVGSTVNITFDNQDAGVPHNIHFYSDAGYSQTVDNAQTQVQAGPVKQTVSFPAPSQPGKYYFRCDVHPEQMKGTISFQ